MKRVALFGLAGLLVVFISPHSEAKADAQSPPNLVLIVADDCTYLDLGVYGGQAKTPTLDRLAAQGITLTRCFQAAAMCSPTRHNLYTGIYPVKSGAWPNHTRVYDGTRSIAHELKDAGYRVALSGKSHVGPKASFPFEFLGDFDKADPTKENPYTQLAKLIRAATREGDPFCIVACSREPHTPYTKGDASAYPPDQLTLPPSWVDTPKTRTAYAKYLAEVTYFDAQCGALLDLLDKQGVTDNTLVMVLSEQGSGFPFAKWTCYEMGLASGMLVRWPGRVKPGSTSDALVEYVDVAPTFLAAIGTPTPEAMDGQSFLPVLLGEKQEHKRYTFGIHTTRGISNGSEQYGVRSCGTKTHRYIRNLHPQATFTNNVTRPGGDKVDFWLSWEDRAKDGDAHAQAMTKKYQHRPAEELYDVAKDPHCLDNLIGDPAYAALHQELADQLDAWMKSQGDEGQQTEANAKTRQGKRGSNERPKANDPGAD